ncbi:hypothetical protein M2119_000646 [Aurantimicrobium minutum]|uniref:sialidase family protein n=1 Tax=Aurantimicrobium minutum TaxID=708131 RepID=UPI002476CDB8|nr:sialidase family protein [Aurantimicrobium minutum]MDH6532409.1 hypothetical protein [Aurantimicrobium minutum]
MTVKNAVLRTFSTMLGAALLVLTFAMPASATASWTPVTVLNASGSTTSQAPQFLSGSDGSLTAITVETVNSVYSVLARRSSDGGATWSSPVALSASGIASSDATAVRLNNGHFAVAWAEASGPSAVNQIRLISSSDNGASWSTTQTISTAGSNAYAATKPHLAAFGVSEVAVGFQQSDGTHDRALVRTSSSSLQSWTQGQTLSATGSDAQFVTPVVNSQGAVVVSWILVASDSTKQTQVAGSSNWNTVTTLTSFAIGGIARVPAVVALPTGAFVVLWADPDAASNPNFVVTAQKSSDAGLTWDVGIGISSAAFPNEITAVVTPEGGISAAWSMGTGGYTYIQSSYSSPTASPSPSPSSSSSSSPSSSSSSTPTSTGAGISWTPLVDVSPVGTGQFYTNPQLAVSPDGTVAMVLVQNVNSTISTGFAESTDNGVTWPQGVGSLSSWLSSPITVGAVSIHALTGQGFAYGWQTLSNNNPATSYVRTYGWVASSSPSSTPAPTLPATGSVLWTTGLLSVAFFGSGLIFWAVTARSRSRR